MGNCSLVLYFEIAKGLKTLKEIEGCLEKK